MSARASRGSYPHPVLDASNDVDSSFEASNFHFTPFVEDIVLRFDIRFNDPTLKRLLDERKARVSLRWRCTATLTNEEVTPTIIASLSDGYQYEYSIDQRKVRGEVQADFRVLAIKPLTAFRWEHQHPDYGDATFDLGVGDVLADGGSVRFSARKLYDPLNPPVGSCFTLMEDASVRKGFRVVLDEETVQVRLSPGLHRDLGLMDAKPELQISAVILPALMETITFIQRSRTGEFTEDLTGYAWYPVISDLMKQYGDLDGSAIEIAQAILAYPVDSTLAQAADATEEDDE